MKASIPFLFLSCALTVRAASAQGVQTIGPRADFDTTLVKESSHRYTIRLRAGESAQLTFMQQGVDIVIDLRGPGDSLLMSFDSPNGRQGDEPVEILAQQSGDYHLLVRPISPTEPAGRYHVRVVALRDVSATSALLKSRQAAKDSAIAWLTLRSQTVASSGSRSDQVPSNIDRLAQRARVIGLGEATHGSREFNDFRFAITRHLIEKRGYRIVALEASSSRIVFLVNEYIQGKNVGVTPAQMLAGGWIGRRVQEELIEWLRSWNRAHPGDHVTLVGLDSQDNEKGRDFVGQFLERAYGPRVLAIWSPLRHELAAADSQSAVFGDSEVDRSVRSRLMSLVAALDLDAPHLTRRFDATAVENARESLKNLAQFADYNSGDTTTISHSRDWYMAVNLLRALDGLGPTAKAVFWGHNAHVAHQPDREPASQTTGGVLRSVLGCDYGAIGATFGSGGFVAQLPNDLEDRLAVFNLPDPEPESIDQVLSVVSRSKETLTTWGCDPSINSLPQWLRAPHPMHWVGALYSRSSAPNEAYRIFDVVRDFDGVVYVPTVTPENLYTDRHVIPARKR